MKTAANQFYFVSKKKKKIDNPHKEKDKISTLSLWKIENIANKPTDPKARKIL